MSTLPTEPPVGGSTWDLDLFAHLTRHVQNEIGLLEQYAKATEGSDSKALAYLVNLLMEDEHRHHRLFAEIAASLKNSAEFSAADPVVPRMDFDTADPGAVIGITERLLQSEERDANELKRLQRELHDVRDTTLWGLLVELMQRDTDKHIAILRFIQHHTPRGRH